MLPSHTLVSIALPRGWRVPSVGLPTAVAHGVMAVVSRQSCSGLWFAAFRSLVSVSIFTALACSGKLDNGRMLLFGGQTLQDAGYNPMELNDMWLFETATNTWTKVMDHCDDKDKCKGRPGARKSAAGAVYGEYFYIAGGYKSGVSNNIQTDFWRWAAASFLPSFDPPHLLHRPQESQPST